MEKEKENLMDEKKQLEAHIIRMQTWCENQGMWRAHVYETEVGFLTRHIVMVTCIATYYGISSR